MYHVDHSTRWTAEADMEATSATIGISDGMHAARAETRRMIDENKGDFIAEYRAIQARLTAADLISSKEAEVLAQLYRIGLDAGDGNATQEKRSSNLAVFITRWQLACRSILSPWSLHLPQLVATTYQKAPTEQS
jgi:hypothetical protein